MLSQTFTVELVTPCFLGGARDQAEWRGASIRGQLRWWFRAVAGPRFEGDLEKVRAAEEEVFGSTRTSSAVRVSPSRGPAAETGESAEALLRDEVSTEELAKRWGKDKDRATVHRLRLSNSPNSNPLHYLAYGPVTHGNLVRPVLPSRIPVSFTLLWVRKPGADAAEIFSLALFSWLCLGGIGARSRKGFGSLHLRGFDSSEEDKSWRAPIDRKTFEQKAGELLALGRQARGLPEWTSFSEGSRIIVGAEGFESGEEALSRLGGWLIAFRRRYGKATDTRVLGGLPVANRDYEWAAPHGTLPRQGFPDRSGFGLPLPFTRRVNGVPMGESVIWTPAGDPRRASPLLLHVARFGRRYFPVLTFLPARFLPEGATHGFKSRPLPSTPPEAPRPDIVTHFLDDLVEKNLVKEIA